MNRAPLGLGLALRRAQPLAARSVARNPVAIRSVLQKRFVQIESLKPEAVTTILNEQRLKRPSSPHFTIYQPQLTWIGSIANRFTGAGLSVLLYGFSIAYLVGPLAGMPFDSAAVVDLVHSLPEWFKLSAKVLLAGSFSFHSFNGLRHLAWDMTKFMTVRGAYMTGYGVLGVSALSTVALVLV
ncbi:cytochrome b560 subunit of succinate dehydrogenase [Exidia glandulosa HHB12029]|uniref:Cytochrome b560 subunit of succinate dehydrogenase n=1 Tax=Exidia glandulosa HHB12029 TaxID=1314781 RepID=A0A166B351_EXIGL|nr:cytochrome b560 subunit of succinate dehydrogenase [Exidia glandulosa HHB12029]